MTETANVFLAIGAPSVAARVVIAELNLELSQLGVRELVQRHFRRADKLAESIGLAETNLTNHVDELAKLDLAIAARIDLFDELCDLLL